MIVTAEPRAPLRLHLAVAGIAFVVGVLWPTSTPPAANEATTTTTTNAAPGVALLQTGTSADAWIEPVPAGNTGALLGFRLTSVRPGSAWDRAGLRDGDLVIAVDGHDVTDLSRVLAAFTGKPLVGVRYERPVDGSAITYSATLNLL